MADDPTKTTPEGGEPDGKSEDKNDGKKVDSGTGDSKTGDKGATPDTSKILQRLEELEEKLGKAKDESITRRQKLKTERQQYQELSEKFEQTQAEFEALKAERDQLKEFEKKIKEEREAERKKILEEFPEDEREDFKGFTLEQLRTVKAKIAGQKKPDPTPGGGKPGKKQGDGEELTFEEALKRQLTPD